MTSSDPLALVGTTVSDKYEIERVVGQLADEGLSEVEPGIDHAFAINDGVAVVVAGLDDADTDDDCWKCRQ